MAYNEEIDQRIRAVLTKWPKKTDHKKMFGGVCYLLDGNMVGGVYKDYLILRLGEERAREALKEPHVRVFDITGRPMKGWVMVGGQGFAEKAALSDWLDQARSFVATLPPKKR